MAKPRGSGVSGNLHGASINKNSLAQISSNPPSNCNLSEADHRAICHQLLPLVSGWERIFLNQIISQSQLSSPQKRKLAAIRDRHFPGQQGGAE